MSDTIQSQMNENDAGIDIQEEMHGKQDWEAMLWNEITIK